MQPLKKEVQAVTAALNEPHESAEDAAAAAIKALDEARTERVTYFAVFRFSGEKNPFFTGYGPFSTKNQALKAIEKHPAAHEAKGMAVVPTLTAEGYEALLSSVDTPAVAKGDWVEVERDRAAFKNGWNGKNATRQAYL